MKKIDYQKKKEEEISVYERPEKVKRNFISQLFHNPIIYSLDRATKNYIFPKTIMADIVAKHLSNKKVKKLLIAPCGIGSDFQYLKKFSNQIYGIDLSKTAISRCPRQMKTKAGDILKSGYPNETFDMIASPLFFHHLGKVGFEPFLEEFQRILKKGGGIVILEPSILYPLNIITRTMKKVFNNPYKEISDESAFYPGLMIKALKKTGFTKIEVHGASFSHSCFYTPLSKVVNKFTRPLLDIDPLKYFAWMNVYWAQKNR
jgi:SAM-dependent methyltransferase